MRYINQIISEMRQQPLIGLITLIGTALAIFLIMVVVMMQEVQVASIAPESNRNRVLHARFIHIKHDKGQSSGVMSYPFAKRLYGNLENADTTTYYLPQPTPATVNVHGKPAIKTDLRNVDAAFWHVFNFTFVNGQSFTAEDVESHLPKAVISEKLARKLFGTTEAKGLQFQLDYYTTITVCGVVKNVPTIASLAYSDIWMPLTEPQMSKDDEYTGYIHATILAHNRNDFPKIKNEVNRRLIAINSQLKAEGREIADHGAPYPQEALSEMHYSNVTPDPETAQHKRWLIYTILLLIPAINLSSMTQSRMRRRISEIGVRRAFGCTRFGIMHTLLGENLIITFVGGMLGLLLSVAFAWLASNSLFHNYQLAATDTGVTPQMLLNSTIFLWALALCFVLNLLTAGIPAWRASRLNPVEAINLN